MNNEIPEPAKSAKRNEQKIDARLLQDYWPWIRQALAKTDFPFSPNCDIPGIKSVYNGALGRKLTYVLEEPHPTSVFFIGDFTVSREDWRIESTFFLGLPEDIPLTVLHGVLRNSQLAANPPSFSIVDRMKPFPYRIRFTRSQEGSWRDSSKEQVQAVLKKQIEGNAQMFDAVCRDIETGEDMVDFLEAATELYGE
jgi:hypothetical protein